MKKYAAFLALLASLQLAWVPVAAQRPFDVKGLGLVSGRQGSKAKLCFGESREAAIKALGHPTKTAKLYSEVDNATMTVFYYRANKLYFLKNQLQDFELNDNTLVFGKSHEQAFSVGYKLTADAKQIIPDVAASNKHKRYLLNSKPLADLIIDTKPGKSRNIAYKTIAYNSIRYGNKNVDASSLEILFDANNRVMQIATITYD